MKTRQREHAIESDFSVIWGVFFWALLFYISFSRLLLGFAKVPLRVPVF